MLHNRLSRTLRHTDAASNTFLVVNRCMEITDRNRILRTVLLAERTADTADLTILHGNRSLILGAAGYRILCIIGYEGNQVLRTNLHTLTTRLTCFLIDNGYSVYDMNDIHNPVWFCHSLPDRLQMRPSARFLRLLLP